MLGFEEFQDVLVHQLHAFGPGGLHDRRHLEGFAFTNQVGDRRVADQDFQSGNASFAIGLAQQLLADNTP